MWSIDLYQAVAVVVAVPHLWVATDTRTDTSATLSCPPLPTSTSHILPLILPSQRVCVWVCVIGLAVVVVSSAHP